MRDVGVVMPVYKQKPSFLRAAIRSILDQTYKKFRLVIVIDGVTSDVLKVVKKETKHDKRVKVIISKQNKGVAKALNRGFKSLYRRKKIKYLTWVSSDNIYYPKYIKEMRKVLKQGPPELGLVYSSFRYIDHKGKPIYKKGSQKEFQKWQNQPKANLLDSCFLGASFMYKKKFAQRIDGYNLQPVEDYDYWLRLTEHCDIKYLPKELMDYRRQSPFSISQQLQSSVHQHRRWRYAFQLAKLTARQRRGIPAETTVIYPVTDGSEDTVHTLEALLSQFYSNYKVIVLDLSPNREATSILSEIPDPRMSFATSISLQNIDTPFTLLYRKYDNDKKMPVFFLENLARGLRSFPPEASLAFYQPDGSVGYTLDPDPSTDVYMMKLLRTEKLKPWIS
jgi:GT2 family glycosyltransferase